MSWAALPNHVTRVSMKQVAPSCEGLQLHSLTNECKFHCLAATFIKTYRHNVQSIISVAQYQFIDVSQKLILSKYGEMEHTVGIKSCCSEKMIDDSCAIVTSLTHQRNANHGTKSTTRSRERHGLALTNKDKLKINGVPWACNIDRPSSYVPRRNIDHISQSSVDFDGQLRTHEVFQRLLHGIQRTCRLRDNAKRSHWERCLHAHNAIVSTLTTKSKPFWDAWWRTARKWCRGKNNCIIILMCGGASVTASDLWKDASQRL